MSRKKIDISYDSLVIEDVAAEGKAIVHSPEGQVIFVDFAVPGDVVDIRVLKKKKNYMEGRIQRIVKPSDMRLEPFCQHFGVCGGCRWQPLPYEAQLKAKQQQVYDQLVRIGHLQVPEIKPIIGSEKTQYYRNKLEFSFSNKRWILSGEDPESLTPEQKCGLGFHVSSFFDKVLDIKDCHLQAEPSNEIRNFCRRYALENALPFYDLRENKGLIRNMVVRSNQNGDIMLTMVYAADSPKIEPMLEAIQNAFPQIKSLYYVINTKLNDSLSDQNCILYKGDEAIYESLEDLKFKIGPKSFFQTNTPQALNLYREARKAASLTGNEVVYDLYTGTGTIAQFVSRQCSRVIGIEYVQEAIEDAKINAKANGISNCEFFAGDMKDVLNEDFINLHGKPDVMIVDPPRAGMHPDVVKTILKASPIRIVYVSCNPATQARDVSMLSGQYQIAEVQPVDMFPHTQHVENICTLTRK